MWEEANKQFLHKDYWSCYPYKYGVGCIEHFKTIVNKCYQTRHKHMIGLVIWGKLAEDL